MKTWRPDLWSVRRLDGGRWLFQCEDGASQELSRAIGAWAEKLRAKDEILDAVPGYRELAVQIREDQGVQVDWKHWLSLGGDVKVESVPIHRVKVVYDGEDLKSLAEDKGMSLQELLKRHQEPTYTVAMVGFRPHFPYLLGLDPALATPRRSNPRLKVPAGSVAIGGEQAGIYPEDSPGGWHLLGKCDPEVCKELLPGHQVRFEALA